MRKPERSIGVAHHPVSSSDGTARPGQMSGCFFEVSAKASPTVNAVCCGVACWMKGVMAIS
ncbi:Uncharacterised protein [Serratia fonticola]|uniref:Uncharacterized protein n=1 Tax=Serratia fonticola TaxID=47917 RepID=A0A4U9WHV6_SERFO|nr:Uncharacterised protein [Serratia fonticola]